MRAYDIIAKKRDGKKLTLSELEFMVNGFVKEEIPDCQMAAFLMACYIKGLDIEETASLTQVMASSGEQVDLSSISGVKVDKHSTGGVGDKTTLVLAPLVAAAGVPVAKMSGRSLGHTGGTLDKLESIPGYKINLSMEEFVGQVLRIGLAVIGAGENINPADKKIYALRDVTATVSSLPLIASSIMSKKIAGGAEAIILDVKVGSGAFMKSQKEAKKLAKLMEDIGKKAERKTVAVITNMDEPLGFAVGNALEVKESIETLKGNGPSDLTELCFELGAHMIVLAGISDKLDEAKLILKDVLASGRALDKFAQWIVAQGGDGSVTESYRCLPQAKIVSDYLAKENGYIFSVNAEEVGRAAMILGAGRESKEDKVDLAVGLVFKKKVGDYAEKGEVLVEIYANDMDELDQADTIIDNAINISKTRPEKKPLILEVVGRE